MYVLNIDRMTKRLLKHIIFSSSLIIYEGKTKEITTVKEVWKSDLNLIIIKFGELLLALDFSKNYCGFEKLYQTHKRVFHPISLFLVSIYLIYYIKMLPTTTSSK